VRKTGRLVIADTSWLEYGMAGEVCRQLMIRDPGLLKKPPSMLGMAPAPCPTAKSLEDIYYPSQHETVDAILTQARGENHGVDLPVERSMTEGYKRFRGPF
jgi:pyruvate dehydrogenase E1 component beta subunit